MTPLPHKQNMVHKNLEKVKRSYSQGSHRR